MRWAVMAGGLLAGVIGCVIAGGLIRRMEREDVPLLPAVAAWMGAERPCAAFVHETIHPERWVLKKAEVAALAPWDSWKLHINFGLYSWHSMSERDIVEAMNRALGHPATPPAGRLRHAITDEGIILDIEQRLRERFPDAVMDRPVTRRDVMRMMTARPAGNWWHLLRDREATLELIDGMAGRSIVPDEWRRASARPWVARGGTLDGRLLLRCGVDDQEIHFDITRGRPLPLPSKAIAWLQPAGTACADLEEHIRHTDLVVVAEVLDIERTIRNDQTLFAVVRARVKETIHGPRLEQISFVLWEEPGLTLSDVDVLCFLQRRAVAGGRGLSEAMWEPRQSPVRPGLRALQPAPDPQILEQVRVAAWNTAASTGPVICLSAAANDKLRFNAVAVNPQLVEKSHRWTASSVPYVRVEAADVLGCAPSPHSTTLLRQLAADGYAEGEPDLLTGRWRSYPVRAAAHEALRRSNASVPRPILYEPQELYRAGMAVVRMIAGVGGLLAMAVLLLPRCRFTVTGMAFRGASIALLAACVTAAGLWVRGRTISDEMRWTTPPMQHQVISRRGMFEYMRLDGWPEEARLAYAAALHGEALDNNWHPLRFPSLKGPEFLRAAWKTGSYGPPPIGPAAPGTYRPFVHVRVPCWMVVAGLAALPAMCGLLWIGRGVRDLRRPRRNCCIGCGYDLRASPERCPECGRAVRTVIAVPAGVASVAANG